MGLTSMIIAKVRNYMQTNDDRRIRTQSPPDGAVVREYRYKDDGDGMHKLNFYYPAEQMNRGVKLPLIVDVHGGGWIYGDKDLNKLYCMYLASRGYAVMGMSYRLLPDTDLRGQVEDIFAACGFIAEKAEELCFDADNVMLTGDSAGAHLASLTYFVNGDAELRSMYGVRELPLVFKCLVLSHGACALHELLLNKDCKGMRGVGAFRRAADKVMFGRGARKSPLYNRSSLEEVSEGKEFPPTMVIGCGKDVFVRHTRRIDAYVKTRCRKYLYDFVATEEGARLGHVYNILRPEWEESVRVNDASLEFFEECIKK